MRLRALAASSTATAALVLTAVLPSSAPASASRPATATTSTPGSASATAPPAAARNHAARFPTRRSAGVPRGWTPTRTVTGRDLVVDQPGAVVEDVRIVNGDLVVSAPNVTIRRVEVQGGAIDNFAGRTCENGMVLKRVSVIRAPGQVTEGDDPVVGIGGYTAKKVAIVGLPEGFRVGGAGECGPVKVVGSWVQVQSPDICEDWHGDGLQGYDGGSLTLKRTVLKMRMTPDCGGTAPFFYPADQGNTSVSIDGLVVDGGGYPFRLGTPGRVSGLHIVAGSWVFGPIDVKCSALSAWGADIATLRHGQPHPVRDQRCSTETGE